MLGSAEIRANVARVQAELHSYDPFAIVEARLAKDGIVAPAAASVTG